MKAPARNVINQPFGNWKDVCIYRTFSVPKRRLGMAKCHAVKDGSLHSCLQSGKIRIRLNRRGRSVHN